MRPNLRWGIAGLVLGLAAALTLPSIAQETSPSPSSSETASDRTVSTTGTAIVRSAPDEALVTLGVSTDAPTAQQAMEDNAAAMSDVVLALIDAGLTEDQLATATLSLWPRWTSDGQAVIGYTAQNQITVTIRDLDRVGRIIDVGVQAGANLTSGITFQMSDTNPAADQALTAAVDDARGKAQLLADASGATLGEVITITETSGSVSPPIVYAEAATADAGGAPTPVLPPTLESQVSVSVTWALA